MEMSVPILPSRDLQETLAFYEALGFENRGDLDEEWGYLILGRGDLWLHCVATPDVDPFSTASSCYLYVDDADALHAAWSDVVEPDPLTGSRVVAPVTTAYGMREFAVVDRSGNLLRIGSDVTAAR
ncbi:bleomycin resistance protein [Nocardioides solisilvae]|uniref:bleomycin resistance protein n=1 Tax=Nocardioides solisilvae TaxID=1542435 RepID=UPI000D74161C|nr:VOC family protein [Nocardioides solisilvae]